MGNDTFPKFVQFFEISERYKMNSDYMMHSHSSLIRKHSDPPQEFSIRSTIIFNSENIIRLKEIRAVNTKLSIHYQFNKLNLISNLTSVRKK